MFRLQKTEVSGLKKNNTVHTRCMKHNRKGRCYFLPTHKDRLKRWEAALMAALMITLCQGVALPETVGCNWWGVMFPGLTEDPPAAQAWNAPGLQAGGVELRFRLLDRLAALR